jgi:predicted  nucleic acid-binding Zn-ribbon protein
MAEEIDLRFLGEQIKRLQGDVRQVKSDMAQMRTDVGGELSRADAKLEAFRETVDDRFDQQIDLVKSSFRSLSQEIASLRESVDVRFESVDVRFEQQLELIKSGFKTLSQEIATLKKS